MARRHSRPPRRPLAKQLLWLGGIALAGGIAVATLDTIDERARTSERVVTVHRLHGCTCVFSWIDSLEAAGFTVRVVEHGSLATIRSTMQTPTNLHGCHVGSYLNYFVEGHVIPEALRSLASQHPIALGVTTATSVDAARIHTSVAEEEHSAVLLVEPSGLIVPWFEPPAPPTDGDHG